jgi:hypothetical protein
MNLPGAAIPRSLHGRVLLPVAASDALFCAGLALFSI